MKRLYFLLAAITVALVINMAIVPGQACELAEADSNEYALQSDNRCEGIRTNIEVSGSLDLVSLINTSGGALGNNLQIRVPRLDTTPPFFLMRTPQSRYQLDTIPFSARGDFYTYSLRTRILKQSNVDEVDDLRAYAVTGSQRVHLPTILGRAGNNYRFVFYSVDNVRFLEAGIRQGSSTKVNWGRQPTRRGEKSFEWQSVRNIPAGRYTFYYTAEIEQRNRPPERITRSIVFEHDPAWLR
ncbi:MAG: hypothetical protein AAGA83_11445 [Cyanobacteria bacterium P01_F01_bin.116]